MRHLYSILLSLVSCLWVVSCKPSIPDRYLQPDELAQILYDYHIAEGIVSSVYPNDTIALRSFKSNILSKYGITESELDTTMAYYVRHTNMLVDVYKKLSDRINGEATSLGASVLGYGGDMAGNADTTNVWKNATTFILSPYSMVNRYSFELKCDTSYHEGDRLMLDFDTKYIYQDGLRDAKVVLALTYDNDSTEYITNQIVSSSHCHLESQNPGKHSIKSIRVLWLMNMGLGSDLVSPSTLRLLIISNVQLVRMHVLSSVNDRDVNQSDSVVSSSSDGENKFRLMDSSKKIIPK